MFIISIKIIALLVLIRYIYVLSVATKELVKRSNLYQIHINETHKKMQILENKINILNNKGD